MVIASPGKNQCQFLRIHSPNLSQNEGVRKTESDRYWAGNSNTGSVAGNYPPELNFIEPGLVEI